MFFPDARTRRLGLGAAAAIAAIAMAGTAAAQSMVVRSTGPSAAKYPPGKKFKPMEKVTLVSGDKVVLIQSGKTRTLSGAGTFNANAKVQVSQNSSTTLSRMLDTNNTGRARGGFTRGDDVPGTVAAPVRAPSLWLVDYRDGGNYCVADPARLLLWSPPVSSDTKISISSDGKNAAVTMKAPRPTADGSKSSGSYVLWPADQLPVHPGVEYRVSGGALTAPVTFRLTPIEAAPETPEQAIDLLMAKGCTHQLDRLVDAMTEEEASAG